MLREVMRRSIRTVYVELWEDHLCYRK